MNPRLRYFISVLLIAAVYFVAARLSLLLAFQLSNATPVWPPSGIALAVLLLLGRRAWPGIALGALFVNVDVFLTNGVCTPGTAVWVSALIAVGNTCEAITGYYLLRKSIGNRPFQRMKQVVKFCYTAPVMCAVSALIGSTAVYLGKIISAGQHPLAALTWWTGDVAGVLVIAPLLIVWANSFPLGWAWVKIKQVIVPFMVLIAATGIVFDGWFSLPFLFTRGFIVTPVLIWIALRLGQREAVTAIALSSIMAIWGTINGHGPFTIPDLNESLLAVQAFVSFNAVLVLAVWAVFRERHETERALRDAQEKLSLLVETRSEQLALSKKEIEEYQNRIDSILDVLLQYAQLNFSPKAPVSDKSDELDAIAEGLNVMGQELFSVRESEKLLNNNLEESKERLFQKNEELTRSNKELEQFAYVVSHDLQEPLRTIGSYVQLLKERYQNKLDKNADEFIGFAVDGTLRMKALINDLLSYSRVSTRPKVFGEVDCNHVVTNVIANFNARLRETDIKFQIDSLPVLKADESHIVQLFQNLISNAIKFKKEHHSQIRISSQQQNGSYLFSVQDNGIGIAPEYKEKIFILFQRLHNRMEYPGTGIGLAICKKIVEQYKGRIWVESKAGEGSTFYFTLGN